MDAKGNTQICVAPSFLPESPTELSSVLPTYLIMVTGGVPGTMIRLSEKTTSVGRSADNVIQLIEGTVSRHHALLAVDDSQTAWLSDLGSTNGSFLDGKRIACHKPIVINDGSRIQLGSTIVFKYLTLDACEEQFQRDMFERTVRDSLTGLYNRGYFLDQVSTLAERNVLHARGLAIMMLDLDHFKSVNDSHGHEAGDLVLREVADLLKESTRPEDLVARYGGEEFILALPSASFENASDRAKGLLTQLFRRKMRAPGGEFRITASLGLCFCPATRERNIAAMITAADEALYEAKKTGRNRVVYATRMMSEAARLTQSADALAAI